MAHVISEILIPTDPFQFTGAIQDMHFIPEPRVAWLQGAALSLLVAIALRGRRRRENLTP